MKALPIAGMHLGPFMFGAGIIGVALHHDQLVDRTSSARPTYGAITPASCSSTTATA